jgi:somatostatin receptor 2
MDVANDLNCSYIGETRANATCALTHASIPFLVLEFAKVLYAIVCMVGLVGNSLVIYVVLRFSKMQTVTNMYILNLALADEMFLIGLPFLIVTLIFKQWIFGNLMCKIYMTTTSINQFTSSLLLTVMSADRFVAVVHPVCQFAANSPSPAALLFTSVCCICSFSLSPEHLTPDDCNEILLSSHCLL